MKRQIGIIMAAWLIASALTTTVRATTDTSYLLIQGPFGTYGTVVTYKWEVNYPAGTLTTSQDLLNAVFGTPIADGTIPDPVFGDPPEYVAGNSHKGAEYAYYPNFDPPGFVAYTFTLNSTAVATDDNVATGVSTLGWNFYVEGGDAADNAEWNLSEEGESSRLLSNDSYDGWVFGDTGSDPDYTYLGPPVTINDSSDSDSPSDFSNNGPNDFLVIIDIPEPSAVILPGLALAAIAFRRRRHRT